MFIVVIKKSLTCLSPVTNSDKDSSYKITYLLTLTPFDEELCNIVKKFIKYPIAICKHQQRAGKLLAYFEEAPGIIVSAVKTVKVYIITIELHKSSIMKELNSRYKNACINVLNNINARDLETQIHPKRSQDQFPN